MFVQARHFSDAHLYLRTSVRVRVRVRAQTKNLLWTNPILIISKPSFSFSSSPSQPKVLQYTDLPNTSDSFIHATQAKLTGLSTGSLCLGSRLASSTPLNLLVLFGSRLFAASRAMPGLSGLELLAYTSNETKTLPYGTLLLLAYRPCPYFFFY